MMTIMMTMMNDDNDDDDGDDNDQDSDDDEYDDEGDDDGAIVTGTHGFCRCKAAGGCPPSTLAEQWPNTADAASARH